MSIQSVGNPGTWPEFVKLASAARVRNAGFELPVAGIRNTATHGSAEPGKTGRLYESKTPQSGQQILGTRFDAYA